MKSNNFLEIWSEIRISQPFLAGKAAATEQVRPFFSSSTDLKKKVFQFIERPENGSLIQFPIPAYWGAWGAWGPCSTSAKTTWVKGERIRARDCKSPHPPEQQLQHPCAGIPGSGSETEMCNKTLCKLISP